MPILQQITTIVNYKLASPLFYQCIDYEQTWKAVKPPLHNHQFTIPKSSKQQSLQPPKAQPRTCDEVYQLKPFFVGSILWRLDD